MIIADEVDAQLSRIMDASGRTLHDFTHPFPRHKFALALGSPRSSSTLLLLDPFR